MSEREQHGRFTPPEPNRWRNFYHFNEVDSTNDEAIRFIGKGISSGIVIADRQTAGRGRGEKSWYSPGGRGLYVSIFEKSDPATALDAAKRAGVALYETIAGFVAVERLLLKWPNDLLIDRKKSCGVLIQHVTRGNALYTVTGIGINMETPDKGAFQWEWEPTSLAEAAGTMVEPGAVLDRLLYLSAGRRDTAPEETDSRYGALVDWMRGAAIQGHIGKERYAGTIVRFVDRFRRIVVIDAEGEERELSAGDISTIRFDQ